MTFLSQTVPAETLPQQQNQDASFLLTLLLVIAGAKASEKQLRKLKKRLFLHMMKIRLQQLFKRDEVKWPLVILFGALAIALIIWIISMGGLWILLGTIAFILLLFAAV